jgi:hypothetical protein
MLARGRPSRLSRPPMRLVVVMLIVTLGFVAGAVISAHADRWPADQWDRLDRGPV